MAFNLLEKLKKGYQKVRQFGETQIEDLPWNKYINKKVPAIKKIKDFLGPESVGDRTQKLMAQGLPQDMAIKKAKEEYQKEQAINMASGVTGGSFKNVGPKAAKIVGADRLAMEAKALAKKGILKTQDFVEANKDNLYTTLKKTLTQIGGKVKNIDIQGESLRLLDKIEKGIKVSTNEINRGWELNQLLKPSTNLGVSVKNINASERIKNTIVNAVDSIKPQIEQKVGKVLTNKEVRDFADNSSRVLKKAIGVEQTKEWEAAMFNLRRKMVKQAETGVVTKDFLDDLMSIKTLKTDIARKFQSFSMRAEAKDATSMQAILENVLKISDNADEIMKAAQGVDFNDLRQATQFYRKYISPKFTEWVDLIRYNSMLSSPLTHIVNTTSNILNTTFVAPLEKTLTGGLDFIGSKITGQARKNLAGEGLYYLGGYLKNANQAFKNFAGVLSGKRRITQLDIKNIPISASGAKGKVVSILSTPMKILEAADQFFMTLSEGAEKSALEYAQKKGVDVGNIAVKATEDAQYRLFRQELFKEGQGTLLDAVDRVTNLVMRARNSGNPVVSTIAKFTVPFVKTPMNILKQGIEYSPLGIATLKGAENKTQQLSKAVIGTMFGITAGSFIASDRITGKEPASEKERDLWKQAGKQAYSIKIGDKWISYQKLPPAISFPFSMIAIINDELKNKKADDDVSDLILGGFSQLFGFMADQSYAKSIGDLLDVAQGNEYAVERWVSNYPQQLIPFRALSGWVARLVDDTQRKIDNKANFVTKQFQLLAQNVPYLSRKVPARVDSKGQPIKSQNRLLNAVSPYKTSTANKEFEDFLNNYSEYTKEIRVEDAKEEEQKKGFMPKYEQIRGLVEQEKIKEARQILNSLTDEEYEIYKKLKSADKTRQTNEDKINMFNKYQRVQDLIEQNRISEAKAIVEAMTDEEYHAYQLLKKKFQ